MLFYFLLNIMKLPIILSLFLFSITACHKTPSAKTILNANRLTKDKRSHLFIVGCGHAFRSENPGFASTPREPESEPFYELCTDVFVEEMKRRGPIFDIRYNFGRKIEDLTKDYIHEQIKPDAPNKKNYNSHLFESLNKE